MEYNCYARPHSAATHVNILSGLYQWGVGNRFPTVSEMRECGVVFGAELQL